MSSSRGKTVLKDIASGDKTSKLQHVETVEKNPLPSKHDMDTVRQEETHAANIQKFNKDELKKTETVESADTVISGEKHKSGICQFDKNQLKHADTDEKLVMPSHDDVKKEKTEKELNESINKFKRSSLKHSDCVEKNTLPNDKVIKQEKKSVK